MTERPASTDPIAQRESAFLQNPRMEETTDSELLEQFRTGDNPNYAFNLMVKKYRQRLYYHIRRIVIDHDDADDVVQNTFIKVWKGLPNFRQDSQLYTWMYRIATNESLTFLKKKRTMFFLPLVNVEKQLEDKLESNLNVKPGHIEMKFQQALLKLPEKQRIVFNLRYYDEMPYEEMSRVLGTSVGALKASYHHAAKKIEKFIRGN